MRVKSREATLEDFKISHLFFSQFQTTENDNKKNLLFVNCGVNWGKSIIFYDKWFVWNKIWYCNNKKIGRSSFKVLQESFSFLYNSFLSHPVFSSFFLCEKERICLLVFLFLKRELYFNFDEWLKFDSLPLWDFFHSNTYIFIMFLGD